MFNSRLINTKVAGGGGCTDIVDNYDPFGDSSGLALWQFNGNALDLSGNYNGTASNVTYPTGVFGQSVNFNGTSTSKVSTDFSFNFDNPFSLSFWVKSNLDNTWQTIASAGVSEYPNATTILMQKRGTGQGSENALRFTVFYNNNQLFDVVDTSEMQIGVWNNYVLTFDGNSAGLYKNGANTVSNVSYSVPSIGFPNFTLGQRKYTPSEFFNGSLDQVRIFNTALTPLEVEALYTEELCICGGTVDTLDILGDGSCIATYPLDGNANDLSGNYSGTPTNVSYGVGEFDLAGVFNGNSSFINTNYTWAFTSIYSISFWAKTSTTNTRQVMTGVLAFNGADASGRFGFGFSSSNTFEFYIANGSSFYQNTSISSISYQNNVWHNFIVVVNGTSIKLYVDGNTTPIANLTSTVLGTTSSDSLFIGKFGAYPGVYFNGSIDQVRIFNKALNSTEVTTLYNETACANTTRTAGNLQILGDSSCIANYRLDGDTTDLSGNYNASINLPNYTNGDFDFALLSTTSTVMTAPAALVGQNHSVSMWINPNSTSGYVYPYGQFAGGVAGRFFANILNGYLGVGIDTSVDYVTTTNPLILKQWNHVVWIKDSTYGWYFYVNNVLAGQVAATNNIYTGANTTFGTYEGLDGSIDQIRIFNKAVTPSEVTTLYNEGI